MKTIKPWIDRNWHTVPLKGTLNRLEDGTKTIPQFPYMWREKYQEEQNTVAAQLGGAITGEVSGVIAIDCDNEYTYNLFRALDPDYECVFVSKGKGYDAGTIIYKYDEEWPSTFSLKTTEIELDFYSNNGFVYLPTAVNTTKEPWTKFHEPKEAPPLVKFALSNFFSIYSLPKTASHTAPPPPSLANCLAPLVSKFLDNNGEYMPGLFRIITPRDFRTHADYVANGHLHPNDIPDGAGSEYLSKISAIFGADNSIDKEMYVEAMHAINDLWESPMDSSRMDQTICDPMLEEKVAINGTVVWQYDENWKHTRLLLTTKRNHSIEVGFDDKRAIYYVVDVLNEWHKTFAKDADLNNYLQVVAIDSPKTKELKRVTPLLDVRSDPSKPFGFDLDLNDEQVRRLNTFVQTPELTILANPEQYEARYRRPNTILQFIESLVPDPQMRGYLLRFVKRKLLRFEYSPVMLYFLGVHGSGKDTFVRILATIMGTISRPSTKEFLEPYNKWLLDQYFVQLDEYGNQLAKYTDKEEAWGKIKSYTGKPEVSIRTMRNDGFEYRHNATFIMTANKNPLGLEDGDRRVALFPTPNKLDAQEWVNDLGGAPIVSEKIDEEIKDFCYYLATEVEEATKQEYTKPPESAAKQAMIADSMFASQRIAFILKHGMIDYIHNLCKDYECAKLPQAIERGFVASEDIEELLDALTDMKGEIKTVNRAIRNLGVAIRQTTRNGSHVYHYDLPWLTAEEPFSEVDIGVNNDDNVIRI